MLPPTDEGFEPNNPHYTSTWRLQPFSVLEINQLQARAWVLS